MDYSACTGSNEVDDALSIESTEIEKPFRIARRQKYLRKMKPKVLDAESADCASDSIAESAGRPVVLDCDDHPSRSRRGQDGPRIQRMQDGNMHQINLKLLRFEYLSRLHHFL